MLVLSPRTVWGRGIRTLFGFSWHTMFVFQQEFFDVSWHGNVQPSFVVIPFEGDPAVKVARPILGDFVLFFDAPN